MDEKLKLPTSDMTLFKMQLDNPNVEIKNKNTNINDSLKKVKKCYIMSIVSDQSGCGHIRNIFPMSFLNAQFGPRGNLRTILSPIPNFQPEVLIQTSSVFLQRYMTRKQLMFARQYKDLQSRYKYKMIYDIDDFIWSGTDEGECLPEYNFCRRGITDEEMRNSIEIMNMMDVVCVSTEFLKKYIKENLKVKTEIRVIPNTIPKYLWGTNKKEPIKKRLSMPKVIYTGSPTHYDNKNKRFGDWDNAWTEWVIKNVKEKKIHFLCMGGLPFFFNCIKDCDNFTFIKWKNSFNYHLSIINEAPDFGISPLMPNYFNYSKSDIKHIEYCAGGMVSIGTVWDNDFPSPYDNNIVKVFHNASLNEIDEIFWNCCEPEVYNDIIRNQYKFLDENGRWVESSLNVNRLLKIFL